MPLISPTKDFNVDLSSCKYIAKPKPSFHNFKHNEKTEKKYKILQDSPYDRPCDGPYWSATFHHDTKSFFPRSLHLLHVLALYKRRKHILGSVDFPHLGNAPCSNRLLARNTANNAIAQRKTNSSGYLIPGTHLFVLPRLPDPRDQLIEVVDDLTDPALVVALRQGLEADLSDDPDATTDHSGLKPV